MKKLIVVIFSLLVFASCSRAANRAMADYINDNRETWATQNVENRLYNMAWFNNRYETITGMATSYVMRINNGETFKDLNAEITILNQHISEYNAKSGTYYMVAWKDKGLPDRLSQIIDEDTLRKYIK
jgi:hypothetical protein